MASNTAVESLGCCNSRAGPGLDINSDLGAEPLTVRTGLGAKISLQRSCVCLQWYTSQSLVTLFED